MCRNRRNSLGRIPLSFCIPHLNFAGIQQKHILESTLTKSKLLLTIIISLPVRGDGATLSLSLVENKEPGLIVSPSSGLSLKPPSLLCSTKINTSHKHVHLNNSSVLTKSCFKGSVLESSHKHLYTVPHKLVICNF